MGLEMHSEAFRTMSTQAITPGWDCWFLLCKIMFRCNSWWFYSGVIWVN